MDNKNLCVILDINLCDVSHKNNFSYYDYINKQNQMVSKYDQVYRFYISSLDDLPEISVTLDLLIDQNESFEINDFNNNRDLSYVDNSMNEHQFETLFSKVYGNDSLSYLEKEYALTTLNGNTLYSDYILETNDHKYAIEENGVTYHHPQIIGEEKYRIQLEKQNSLMYYNFKVYRWSSEHIAFSNVMEDNIQHFFGDKSKFINKFSIKQDRPFELYLHQENILDTIEQKRKNGVEAFLVVIPTATGKSQIALEDVKREYFKNHKLNVLIISPSTQLKLDWENRIENLRSKICFENLTYVGAYKIINNYDTKYFDYIIIDEAHHAVTPTCKKVIKHFSPSFILGLTATPERLDNKKLEEVFGSYNVKLTLKEAIEKDVISPIRAFRIESNINLSEVRYNGIDYRNSDIERAVRVESRNELIAKILRKYFANDEINQKQGIIFCVNINHAKEMVKVCKRLGIKAEAVFGGNSKNNELIEKYRNKQIQFLCACNMISEGWDEPSTEIVVMARPTLSKVLYLQQLGRGLRKYKDKEALYVIDVVDQYGMMLKPWSIHSIFNINFYKPFTDVLNINKRSIEMVLIQGLLENEISVKEIDIETFEEKYKDYLSQEQLARELFVSTGTVISWVKKKEVKPEVSYLINKTVINLFAPFQKEEIRNIKNLKERTEYTIKDDFFEFINDKNYTFSFKLIFMLSFLKAINKDGEADTNNVLDYYKKFYLDRIKLNLEIDKRNCIYNKDYLDDIVKIKQSMFNNPFEKYERKRFIYQCKDLNKIAFNPTLWEKLSKVDLKVIKKTYIEHLEEYYQNYDGLQNIDYLK